ncbi:ribosomal protein L9 [Treponema socranskii subsp. paredis ATCC 35535]|nr:ribosomal protein L9 [Treponema socranskii subsp. paredis ATCC 35535]
MKVILNTDIKTLGEEGDIKNVADGYFRNFLRPRRLAVPYNAATVAFFESRKAEIEARKEQKRRDSASLKEKLEALHLEITMPAGRNGKLFGAVSAQVISDLLAKNGFEIERKRIEIPGVSIKSVGNYHFSVKLYEAQTAQMIVSVKGEESAEAKDAADDKAKKAKAEKADAASANESAEAAAEKASENVSEENVPSNGAEA